MPGLGQPWAGHPRLSRGSQDVDGRDKAPAMTSFNLIGKRSNVYGRKMIMGSTVRAVAGAAR